MPSSQNFLMSSMTGSYLLTDSINRIMIDYDICVD